MNTPIADFVTKYVASDAVRFHMPGHKGQSVLGCEKLDITEISGADALYEASGIIAESEANATELFGTGRTLYSTEGSSQCVRAMLELARRWWVQKTGEGSLVKNSVGKLCADNIIAGNGKRPVVIAARNAHKAFLYAAILLDFDVVWLWPEEENASLCSCVVMPSTLERVLSEQKGNVAAVYLTSPNYLGGIADIATMATICHQHNTLLLVDNAHGAYLHFLENSRHPMDLGADLCCDSAHKTLPVLTGGAYLHIGKNAPEKLAEWSKGAMELFGSTSPSYLILQSLDLCNRYLSDGYRERLKEACEVLENCRCRLKENGWQVEETDPLRLTIKAPCGLNGMKLAEQLRSSCMECEYADEDYLVLMVTPENTDADFERLITILGKNKLNPSIINAKNKVKLATNAERVMNVRDAYFSNGEIVPVENALGRICRMPTATCPPAIPVVVPGERIDELAVQSFLYYGITQIEVVQE
ncbi:MAG: aminotransferase class V-fold PLP-dependent enzyme [Lachnospiraceae bacterium]|nr:aminotransferase class V-fold PLP-dependent enzyme [Lachnospiraceae bacterium]